MSMCFKSRALGTSLAIQWLRLLSSNAGDKVQFLVRELRIDIMQGAAKKFLKE